MRQRTKRLYAALLGTTTLIAGIVTAAASSQAAGTVPVPGDPLTGSGVVSRTVLTYADLTTGSSSGPVDDGAFAIPAAAAAPTHTFQGTVALNGVASSGGFTSLYDPDRYSTIAGWRHMPAMSVQFVQNGSYLIPTARGLTITGSSYWNLIVSPGRAWNETADHGYTRASFPFALVERNQNCVHNGIVTFLFTDTSTTKVRYQVTQETCEYYKFNMWGQVSGSYAKMTIANADTIANAFVTEFNNRLPAKPIAALATDYPASGVNTAVFGSGITAADMTTYGLYYKGVNYVSACGTRYGSYAYCGEMAVPSYSTSKSAMASVGLMYLTQKYGSGVGALLIKNYVSQASSAAGNWSAVTIRNALDMATGNYTSSSFEVDEGGTAMSNFFLAEPYTTKTSDAFVFPYMSTPGTTWVYHSSDTYIATLAMNSYLQSKAGSSADVFNTLRDNVYTPIRLSPDSLATLRTDNSASGKPIGGYGMFWNQDNIAKVAKLLNNDAGKAGTTQLLDPSLLSASMQKNAANRGLVSNDDSADMYNNGFWGRVFTPADSSSYTCTFYVPFMSGYGGITVAMMPNGATYYYFSDNGEFSWNQAISEANKLSPQCG
jgi:hypothetical protein